MNLQERQGLGQLAAWLGVGGNLLLAAGKLAAGVAASSHALVADALHSLADFGGSVVLLIVMRVAHAPSDADHPYGHGKAEPVGAKLIGIIVILAGVQVGLGAVGRLRAGNYAAPGALAVWIALSAALAKGAMFLYQRRVGQTMRSLAVMASAQEHRADAYSSLAVVIGVTLARRGWPFFDPLTSLVVAGFIIRLGWTITRRAVDDLMDRLTAPQLRDAVLQLGQSTPGVWAVNDVRLRAMGPEWVADLKIEVDPSITVKEGHRIASQLGSRLSAAFPDIAQVLVHVNPAGWQQPETLGGGEALPPNSPPT